MSRIFPLRDDETPDHCPFCFSRDIVVISHPGSYEFNVTTQTAQQCNYCRETFYSMNRIWVEDPMAYNPTEEVIG
jgi:hypothetical protein